MNVCVYYKDQHIGYADNLSEASKMREAARLENNERAMSYGFYDEVDEESCVGETWKLA